jgi:predicted MFS family arabinose efflux permease
MLALMAVTVVMLAAFLVVQIKVAHPVVALSVFRNRGFSLAVFIALLNFIAFGATLLLLPFMLQNQMGLEVTKVGLVMAVISLATLLFASTGGILSDRFGPRLTVTAGLLLRAAGLIAIGLLAAGATVPMLILPMVAVGVGQALFQPPNASAMLSALSPNRAGLAGGFLALSRTFGVGLGQAGGGRGGVHDGGCGSGGGVVGADAEKRGTRDRVNAPGEGVSESRSRVAIAAGLVQPKLGTIDGTWLVSCPVVRDGRR